MTKPKVQTRLKPLLSTVAMTALLSAATFTTPADAAEDNGFYARAGIGANWASDADNKGTDTSLDVESDYDTGLALSGGLGFRVNPHVRVEGEVTYRDNDVDSLNVRDAAGTGVASGDASGDFTSWGGMVNGYLDLAGLGPVPAESPLNPYVTAGIGLANVDADVTDVNGASIVDDDDTVFAYQLGAGVGYSLNERVTLDLGYRYYAADDPDFTSTGGVDFESESENHTVMAGVRYSF